MWNRDDLRRLRLAEVSQVIAELAELGFSRGSLLEIGAGSGWQAKMLADNGFEVQAVDIASSNYSSNREFPVQEYDGKHLPFPEATFDIVFSSNVLEHIAWAEDFQQEMLRVLKQGGISIHLVPTSSWRLWTTVLHPVFVGQYIRVRFSGEAVDCGNTHPARSPAAEPNPPRSRLSLLRTAVFTRRHGEIGNCLSEQYYFSRFRWSKLFESSGWQEVRRIGNRLAYTGHGILGSKLSINTRKRLSAICGSSCHLFIMRKEVRKAK